MIKFSVVPRGFNVNETETLTADFCFNENLNSGAQMAAEKKEEKETAWQPTVRQLTPVLG